ncbi:MAG: sugar ABC transporter substrate-binding protein [Azospirillaceae bacterium]|nr:sugar ABC transporter substrate-binding protein [Azospirillaceae bacterium]
MIKATMMGLVLAMAAVATAQAEPVTVKVWALDEPTRITETFAREFEARNPDVKIDVKLVNFANIVNDAVRAAATGTAPDITMIDNPEVALFASHNILLDLTPLLAQSKVIDRNDFYPGPIANSTWQGRIVAIPRGANTIALYYNADLFKEVGLNPDQPPRTWAELYDAARKLTDPAKHRYGLVFSAIASEEGTFQFLPWVQTAGADFDTLGSDGALRALQFWQKLVDDKVASPDVLVYRQNDATGQFAAGNAAMSISGPWELPTLQKDAHFTWRVALLPGETATSPRASALGEFANAIFKTSAHPAEAFRFLEYIYSQAARNWNEFGMLPANRSAAPQDPKWPDAYAVFVEQMKYARGRGPHPLWPQISKAIQTAIQSTLTHQSDARTALATAQASIDKILKK